MLSAGKISCCNLTEINLEFWSRPTRQKQILTGLLVTIIYKNRTLKVTLLDYSMLGYISPITTSLLHIYRRNSCPTHIFKPTHHTWLQTLSHLGIFQTNLPLFGSFVDFYNQAWFPLWYFVRNLISCWQPYNRYVKLHWAQFQWSETLLQLKVLKNLYKDFLLQQQSDQWSY